MNFIYPTKNYFSRSRRSTKNYRISYNYRNEPYQLFTNRGLFHFSRNNVDLIDSKIVMSENDNIFAFEHNKDKKESIFWIKKNNQGDTIKKNTIRFCRNFNSGDSEEERKKCPQTTDWEIYFKDKDGSEKVKEEFEKQQQIKMEKERMMNEIKDNTVKYETDDKYLKCPEEFPIKNGNVCLKDDSKIDYTYEKGVLGYKYTTDGKFWRNQGDNNNNSNGNIRPLPGHLDNYINEHWSHRKKKNLGINTREQCQEKCNKDEYCRAFIFYNKELPYAKTYGWRYKNIPEGSCILRDDKVTVTDDPVKIEEDEEIVEVYNLTDDLYEKKYNNSCTLHNSDIKDEKTKNLAKSCYSNDIKKCQKNMTKSDCINYAHKTNIPFEYREYDENLFTGCQVNKDNTAVIYVDKEKTMKELNIVRVKNKCDIGNKNWFNSYNDKVTADVQNCESLNKKLYNSNSTDCKYFDNYKLCHLREKPTCPNFQNPTGERKTQLDNKIKNAEGRISSKKAQIAKYDKIKQTKVFENDENYTNRCDEARKKIPNGKIERFNIRDNWKKTGINKFINQEAKYFFAGAHSDDDELCFGNLPSNFVQKQCIICPARLENYEKPNEAIEVENYLRYKNDKQFTDSVCLGKNLRVGLNYQKAGFRYGKGYFVNNAKDGNKSLENVCHKIYKATLENRIKENEIIISSNEKNLNVYKKNYLDSSEQTNEEKCINEGYSCCQEKYWSNLDTKCKNDGFEDCYDKYETTFAKVKKIIMEIILTIVKNIILTLKNTKKIFFILDFVLLKKKKFNVKILKILKVIIIFKIVMK